MRVILIKSNHYSKRAATFIPAYWWYSIEFGEKNEISKIMARYKKKYFPVVTEEIERNNEQQKEQVKNKTNRYKRIRYKRDTRESDTRELDTRESDTRESDTYNKDANVENNKNTILDMFVSYVLNGFLEVLDSNNG